MQLLRWQGWRRRYEFCGAECGVQVGLTVVADVVSKLGFGFFLLFGIEATRSDDLVDSEDTPQCPHPVKDHSQIHSRTGITRESITGIHTCKPQAPCDFF